MKILNNVTIISPPRGLLIIKFITVRRELLSYLRNCTEVMANPPAPFIIITNSSWGELESGETHCNRPWGGGQALSSGRAGRE